MAGWIKLHRNLTEWEWYTDANTMRVFMHLLLKANHKDTSYRGKKVKRGQMLTGVSALASQLNLTPQKIKTALNNLESTGEITKKGNQQGTSITICNYDSYQDLDTSANQQLTSEITSKQPVTNQQLTSKQPHKKNVKKEENERMKEYVELIWKSYPNKKGKAKAITKIPKLIKLHSFEEIMTCVDRYRKETIGKDLQHVAHGSTFFNGTYVDYLDENYEAKPQPLQQNNTPRQSTPEEMERAKFTPVTEDEQELLKELGEF